MFCADHCLYCEVCVWVGGCGVAWCGVVCFCVQINDTEHLPSTVRQTWFLAFIHTTQSTNCIGIVLALPSKFIQNQTIYHDLQSSYLIWMIMTSSNSSILNRVASVLVLKHDKSCCTLFKISFWLKSRILDDI